MVVVPAATAVTTPELEMVATPKADEDQGLVASGLVVAVRVELNPTQALKVPDITGFALTIKLAVVVQPLLSK
jgi:hypothetical protein